MTNRRSDMAPDFVAGIPAVPAAPISGAIVPAYGA
jgi:hypothetical protein